MRFLIAFALLALLAGPVYAASETQAPEVQKQKTDTATQHEQPKVEPRQGADAQKQKGNRAEKGEKTDRAEKGGKARGGFTGPVTGGEEMTVAAIKAADSETPVILTGKLVSRQIVPANTYIFKDDSGEIRVKIPQRVFGANQINPDTNIRIQGLYKKDDNSHEVDVIALEVLQ